MSKAEEVKLFIKVVINKEKTKVLFVEAGSDFTDILLSFLTLPLSTIVNILDKHFGDKAPVIGSLNTLRDGVANLDSVHFLSENAKEKYLNPESAYGNMFGCLKLNCIDPSHSYSGEKYDGVFTRGADSFVISDDLQILPADSIINTLSKLSIAITDMDGAKTSTVGYGLDGIMNLLKELFVSRNPLTAILGGSRTNLETVKYEHRDTQIDEEAISMNPKKMVLKVVIQKSTFKLLFAQADTDFVNFLFSLLLLPLGRVEQYLGSNTGRKSIDNLHRSIALDNLDNYLNAASTKDNLTNPTPPTFYFLSQNCSSNEFCHLNFDPNRTQNPVKGSRMYMVSDNLTVAPMAITSSLSVINELKIPLSDVRELELQVGLKEGLNILKAALTSTTALTDGLIKPMLKKPKQES